MGAYRWAYKTQLNWWLMEKSIVKYKFNIIQRRFLKCQYFTISAKICLLPLMEKSQDMRKKYDIKRRIMAQLCVLNILQSILYHYIETRIFTTIIALQYHMPILTFCPKRQKFMYFKGVVYVIYGIFALFRKESSKKFPFSLVISVFLLKSDCYPSWEKS